MKGVSVCGGECDDLKIYMTDEKIYDFIIAGNVCAFLLAQKNKSCLILEKQPRRTEKICGGGKVSPGIQRRLSDEFLLQQAIGAGAEIFYGVPVSTVKYVGKIFRVNERYLLKKNPRGQSFGLSVLTKGFSLPASDKFYFWYGDDSGDKYYHPRRKTPPFRAGDIRRIDF